MKNEKRNHHFIAQTEQVMHARSSEVSSKRINRFEVLDKRRLRIKRTTRKGVTIANNLSFEDLYCFDFLSRDEQFNFESTFGSYEEKYKGLIAQVISQTQDVGELYLDLFTYKWMNIIRNPFCIKETLKMFDNVLSLYPVDNELLPIYQRVDTGNKPQEKRVCEYFNITSLEYTNWLKILFLVLSVKTQDKNVLETFSRAMFYERESSLNIFLFAISEDKATIFSDIGFASISDGTHLSYEFPLTSKHYVAFGFTNLDSFTKQLERDKGIDLSDIQGLLQSKPKEIRVKKIVNDLERLKSFNIRMVEQSHQYVFSQSTKPFVL